MFLSSGDILFIELLPNKIQKPENGILSKSYSQVLVAWTDKNNYPDASGDFSNAPNFNFNDDQVKFDANSAGDANDNYGSASGFSPKPLLKVKGHPYGVPFSLTIFTGANPAAQHPADFINQAFKTHVREYCLMPRCIVFQKSF